MNEDARIKYKQTLLELNQDDRLKYYLTKRIVKFRHISYCNGDTIPCTECPGRIEFLSSSNYQQSDCPYRMEGTSEDTISQTFEPVDILTSEDFKF